MVKSQSKIVPLLKSWIEYSAALNFSKANIAKIVDTILKIER